MQEYNAIISSALPPPIHGQSVATRFICDHLRSASNNSILVLNTSPGSFEGGVLYHARRIFLTVRSIAYIFLYGRNGAAFYTVFESGYGFLYNLLQLFLARLKGMRIFIHHHTSFHLKKQSKSFNLVNMFCGKDASHIVLSDKMKLDLVNRYKFSGSVIVLNNALFMDSPLCAPKPKVFNRTVVFGMLANHCTEKGSVEAIRIIHDLVGLGHDVSIVLAGAIRDNATRLAISNFLIAHPERLVSIGPVYSSADKADFFSSIDYFIFPSLYKFEAQPIVILEAMSFGIPTFASDAGYIPDLVGEAGTIISDISLASNVLSTFLANTDDSSHLAFSLVVQDRFADLRTKAELGLRVLTEDILR